MAIGGILAGAMGGLGNAMQHNAQGQIEEKRQRALMALEQDMAFERQDREWNRDDQVWERKTDREDMLIDKKRGWEVEDRDLGYQHEWGLTKYRQGQQNYRSSLSASGRGGIGGDLSDVQKRYLDRIEDQMTAIRESAVDPVTGESRPLTPEEKLQMGQLDQQWEQIATGGAGPSRQPTTFERLMQGEGGGEGGGVGNPGSGEGGEEPPDAAGNYMQSREQDREDAERSAELDQRVEAMADDALRTAGRINNPLRGDDGGGFVPGGMTGIINRGASGGIDVAEEREIGRLMLDEIAQFYAEETDPDRRATLERAMNALQDAGVNR